MKEIVSSNLFGILLTLIVFKISVKIFNKLRMPIFNPLLLSIIIIVIILKIFDISYEDYFIGASVLNSLIVPATVALAIPLYKNFNLLKKHYKSIILGIVVGNTLNIIVIILLCKLLNYDYEIIASFIPKSITTAIAIGVSENIGGITSITVILVIVTGITGAVLGPSIFKLLKIEDNVAIGVSLGSASHAVGSSKAIEINDGSGAMAGLSIILTGIYVIFISPILIRLML